MSCVNNYLQYLIFDWQSINHLYKTHFVFKGSFCRRSRLTPNVHSLYWISVSHMTTDMLNFVVNIFRTVPHAWFITGFVTRLKRRMPAVEQELLTLSEHLTSYPVFSEVRVTRSLVLCVSFVDRCVSLCPLFGIALSVLLRFMDSDYPFGIFKHFL